MTKFCRATLAAVFVATFSWAADTDQDGIPDHEDPWPNDSSKPVVSLLWGVHGENWTPGSRLPFVGFAGYRDGNEPIPDVTRMVANVVDFGATGTDGSADDTQAFLDAIAHAAGQVSATNHGAILVPAGVYDVNTNLLLDTSGMVLKGAGRDATTIRFTYTGDAKGITMGSGGLNWQYNKFQSNFNCQLDTAQMPQLGDFTLHLAAPMSQAFKDNLAAQGNRARIAQWINRAYDGATPQLVENIYGGPLKPQATGHSTLAQEFNVTVVNDSTLEMDRPLRWTPTTESLWNQPVLVSVRDTSATESQEIGVEGLTIRFQAPGFLAHNGIGENGIAVKSDHSWVRDVRVQNSDNSITINQDRAHVTVSDVIVEADRSGPLYGPGTPWYYKVYGHVGIGVNGYDNLLRDFVINNTYIHDVSMRHSQGCVVAGGQGTEMCMDHHRQVIYANVWTDIDVGNPHRMWDSTGDPPEGYQCAAYNSWWNITSSDPSYANWPDDGNWMHWGTNMWGHFVMNLVGTDLTNKPPLGGIPRAPDTYDPANVHLEAIDQAELWPQNIYLAQREAYLNGHLWVPAVSNTPPVADPQNVSATEGVSEGIVLTGSDANGDALSFQVETQPAHGTLSGTAPNLSYLPATNYNGSDSFTFTVSDGVATSTTATVSITVLLGVAGTYVLGQHITGDTVSSGTNTVATFNVQPGDVIVVVSASSSKDEPAESSIALGGGTALLDPVAYAPADPWKGCRSSYWYTTATSAGTVPLEVRRTGTAYYIVGAYQLRAASGYSAPVLIGSPLTRAEGSATSITNTYALGTNYTGVCIEALSTYADNFAPVSPEIAVDGTGYANKRNTASGTFSGTASLDSIWSTANAANQLTWVGLAFGSVDLATTDTDGDGLTDAQEMALGTDPRDPASVFAITDTFAQPSTDRLEVVWPSATGVLYRILGSPDLTNWAVVSGWTNALTPPEDTLELDLSPSNGFFKVEAEIQ